MMAGAGRSWPSGGRRVGHHNHGGHLRVCTSGLRRAADLRGQCRRGARSRRARGRHPRAGRRRSCRAGNGWGHIPAAAGGEVGVGNEPGPEAALVGREGGVGDVPGEGAGRTSGEVAPEDVLGGAWQRAAGEVTGAVLDQLGVVELLLVLVIVPAWMSGISSSSASASTCSAHGASWRAMCLGWSVQLAMAW